MEGSRIAQPISFGDLLRSLRRAASLSQEELAQRAKLSVKAIGALERGERQHPYPATVRTLADALGLSNGTRSALLEAARREPGEGEGDPDTDQQFAAWELYVELVTRLAVAELGADEGLLRDALTSLHSLFGTTRAILRRYGPSVARAPGDGVSMVCGLAIAILNEVLRPFLSVWHPLLLDHESQRPPGVAAGEHERAWARNREMRAALADLRTLLEEHARLLAIAADVPHPLVPYRVDPD